MDGNAVSNNDLMVAVLDMKQELGKHGEMLNTVIKLQKHTNGDVAELRLWRAQTEAAQEALDKYKKEQPVITHADSVIVKPGFFDNPKAAGLITALIAVLLALAGYLTYLVGGRS